MSGRKPYDITISVNTRFLDDQSAPGDNRYAFAYTITIVNEGSVGARLLSRHWVITDGNGKVHEVRGDGVVGEQPWVRPGDDYEYTSGAVLETALGTMHVSGESDEREGYDGERRNDRAAVRRLLGGAIDRTTQRAPPQQSTDRRSDDWPVPDERELGNRERDGVNVDEIGHLQQGNDCVCGSTGGDARRHAANAG